MIFLLTQDKITFHVQVLIEDKVYTHRYGKGTMEGKQKEVVKAGAEW